MYQCIVSILKKHNDNMYNIYIYICGRLLRFAKIKILEQCEEAKKCGFAATKKSNFDILAFVAETFAGPFFRLRDRNSVCVVRSLRVSEFAFSYKNTILHVTLFLDDGGDVSKNACLTRYVPSSFKLTGSKFEVGGSMPNLCVSG